MLELWLLPPEREVRVEPLLNEWPPPELKLWLLLELLWWDEEEE